MVAKYLQKAHTRVTILLVLLVFVVAACGPNSAPPDSGAAEALVTAGEVGAASESESTPQEEHAATDDDHRAATEDEEQQHDADNDADSSSVGMMGGEADAMHGMMDDDEAMGHDEAAEHDEQMGHMEGGGHEDMAAAHNVPEKYATMENPIEATDRSIARGAELFQATCAVCHGTTGHGDGVGAAGLDPKPANLSEDHVQGNPDGALFYTISKGVPGTAMVAWESQISEEDRWNLVNFVRTIEPQ